MIVDIEIHDPAAYDEYRKFDLAVRAGSSSSGKITYWKQWNPKRIVSWNSKALRRRQGTTRRISRVRSRSQGAQGNIILVEEPNGRDGVTA